MSVAFSFPHVLTATQLLERAADKQREGVGWSWGALSGRMVELSGESSLTAAFALVLDAQLQGEPVAWVSAVESVFFAIDAVESGVDLEALPLVRVLGAQQAARAADKLLRSGAFGLIVVDLEAGARVPMPLQGRLLRLAEKHQTALVMLTENAPDNPSLSALVSLRAQATRRHVSDDRFVCQILAIKDKRRLAGWSIEEVCRGPLGLR
ncbi:MAG: recombinase A [Bradymonadaceae bacterium]|nr:recombinase A [Lujinxingiaceae bacterium]